MTQVWVNNYTSLLVADCLASATEMTVNSAPVGTLGVDEYLLLTLEDANVPSRVEIVKVTAVVGDVLTIVRGQENTVAQDYFIDDITQGRMTAGTLTDLYQKSGGVMTGPMDMGGNGISGVPTGTPTTADEAVSANYVWKKEPEVSGLLTGGLIEKTTDTTITVSAGTGIIVDTYSDPEHPDTKEVSWPTTVPTVPGISTEGRTHVFINAAGAVEFYPGELTPVDTRDRIRLGLVYHAENIVVSTFAEPTVAGQNGPLLYDFINFVTDTARLQGGFVKAQPAGNLKLVRGAVAAFVPGGSWHDTPEAPNLRDYVEADPALMRYINQLGVLTGGLGGQVEDVDPTRWDNAGVVETVPNPPGNVTIQYLFMMPSGNHLIQWGQKVYANLGEAVDASGQDIAEFIPSPGTEDGFLLCQVIMEKGALDLTSSSQAQIFNTRVGYSGGSSSGLYVLRSGDSMTGPLVLPGTPTGPLDATDKTYVDDADGILAGGISDNADDILVNAGNISTNAGNISTNAGNISTNTGNISTNTGNIATNASDIVTNAGNISDNAAGLDLKLNLTGGSPTGDIFSSALIQADLGFVSGGGTWPNDANMGVYNNTGGTGVSQSAAGYSGIYQYDSAGGYEKPILLFSRNGQASLYYNGLISASTEVFGLNVGHSSHASDQRLTVLTSAGGVRFYNSGPTGNLGILQTSNGGVYQKTWMEGIRDGGVNLFHNDALTARTTSSGFESLGKLKATAPSADRSCLELIQDHTPNRDLVTVTFGGTLIGGWNTAFRVMSWGPLVDLSASDERTKENISNIPYGLDTILALRPTRHQYKEEFALGQRDFRLGFIAQEVMEVCADLYCSVDDDRMPDGIRHGVQESSLIPILVKAVQELTARVAALGG